RQQSDKIRPHLGLGWALSLLCTKQANTEMFQFSEAWERIEPPQEAGCDSLFNIRHFICYSISGRFPDFGANFALTTLELLLNVVEDLDYHENELPHGFGVLGETFFNYPCQCR
mgnify:CR=1